MVSALATMDLQFVDCGILYVVDLLRHGRTGEQQSLVLPTHLYRTDHRVYYRLARPRSAYLDCQARAHYLHCRFFIAARYGKSQGLAVVVTLIAVAGILPYIALQLRGITMGLEIIAPDLASDLSYQNYSVSWFVVGAMAIFTMLFGTRHIDNTEHHRGMMMAIAFESVLKLVAFLVVGVFIVWLAMDTESFHLADIAAETYESPNIPTLLIHTILTMLAIVCLPRQFHTMVVENERAQDFTRCALVIPVVSDSDGHFRSANRVGRAKPIEW